MFLDEPTKHLDIHHQIEILRMVRDLDLTSIVALHDLNLAALFCDRIAVLQNGVLVACGRPAEVLTQSLLRDIFRVQAEVSDMDQTGRPHIRFKTG
jgi:iron complex transport system ATP-binding protein